MAELSKIRKIILVIIIPSNVLETLILFSTVIHSSQEEIINYDKELNRNQHAAHKQLTVTSII